MTNTKKEENVRAWSWLVEEIKNKIDPKLGYTVTSDWWLGGVRISVDSGRGFSYSAHADEIKTAEAFIDSMKRHQYWHVVSCRTDEKSYEKQPDGRVKVICRGEKTHEDGSTVSEWHYFEDYSPHTKYDGIFD